MSHYYEQSLFQDHYPIGPYLDGLKADLRNEISRYDPNAISTAPEEELCNYFLQKYTIEVPILRKDALYMEEEPKEVTIHSQRRDWFDEEMVNVTSKGLSFTICVPFEGNSAILRCQPTNYTYTSGNRTAKGQLKQSEIILSYQGEISKPEQIESMYQHDLGILEKNFENIARDVGQYNNSLPQIIRDKIAERKKEVETNKSVISSIKIPIKRREDLPATYVIPEIRRKPKFEVQTPPKARTPEPTLAEEEYEHILGIVKDMSVSMERSPQTFSKLKEPEIRDIFLVHLNGHYQGSATGETFNGVGKTDILIRHQNVNAFIAECKFWKGQKSLTEAISQLLGYVVWRDTKTAIFLFHKGDNFTDVLSQIEGVFEKHPNYRGKHTLKDSKLNDNTVFSYKFVHPSDKEKEFILSVLAYQITPPTK